MSNLGDFKKRLAGTDALGIGGKTTINQAFDIVARTAKAADDSMAADATSNTKFFTNPFDFNLEVVGAKYSANGTITASDTNYATLQVKTDDAAAGTPAVAAAVSTTTTGTGNVAAHVAEDLAITAANAILLPGANLWLAITKTASGVVVRAGEISVRLRKAE